MKFSDNQKSAISHLDGPALVLAVPGSGKTTVLLARINNLINHGVNPDNILAMTFSKSQALDMENRYKNNYGTNDVKFSTIHSFAYGIVRKFYHHPIKLIEQSREFNKYKIINQIYYNIKFRKMDDEKLDEFLRVSSFLKNTLMDYSEYKKMYSSAFSGFEDLFNKYEKFKKGRHLIDFDDMLLIALHILQNDEKALEFLQNKFKYIQIDEGQDTSFVQLKIISLISEPNDNLFIVADDDQSIYGFRGASSKQLLAFPQNYPDAKIYYMTDNFRSTKYITEVANKLIENNKQRYEKKINTNNTTGKNVSLNSFKNTVEQSKFVIQKAIEHAKNSETTAILYRNNISSINLLNLIPDDMNFYIKDGKFAFYTNSIIDDIFSILNFAKDPSDILIFEKIYYKFNLYIKKSFIEEIKFMDSRKSIVERLLNLDNLNDFYIDNFYTLEFHLDKINKMDFDKAVKFIFTETNYYDYLKELSRRKSKSTIALDRIVDTILNISKDVKSLVDFQNKIKHLIDLQKISSKNDSLITLSTIHGSKGLEFDNVYMIDLIDKEFPSSFTVATDESLGILEEDRRLFYVGMTRAKKNLSLNYPLSLFKTETNPSTFIYEIKK